MKKAGLSLILMALALVAVGAMADARQPKTVPRIGFLGGGSPSAYSPRIEAFRKTAKQISLTIPPNVLARADKVIR